MGYLLGDSDIAARRLKLVAEVFAPSTEAFLMEAVEPHPPLALDLGCGPGHTTRLLARVLEPEKTVGLEKEIEQLEEGLRALSEQPEPSAAEKTVTWRLRQMVVAKV